MRIVRIELGQAVERECPDRVERSHQARPAAFAVQSDRRRVRYRTGPIDMLRGQIACVVERLWVLEVARRANLRRHFHSLPVLQRKFFARLQVCRQPNLVLGGQPQRKLLAVWREYRRVHYAPAEHHRFAVTGG